MEENLKDICGTDMGHEDLIKENKANTLCDDHAYHLAEFFKVYSDETRLKIIHLLSLKELCVHEIAGILDMSQSAISHQLKVLRNQKLVKPRKSGKHVFYSLSDDHVVTIFKNGLDHIVE
ncbi:MAG: metalloregulator ArsR/SmtB family transcription factor [Erysipelotrichales bacterium]